MRADLAWTLGPALIQPYSTPHPYQFPDSAFPVLAGIAPAANASAPQRLMFWTDGATFRAEGYPAPGSFPVSVDPPSPVLGSGPNGSYDGNGNWLLAAFRLGGAASAELVGFAHTENHVWRCPGGGHGEWNSGAVLRSADDGRSWSREGLAISDPQPCNATFGGAGFSSVVPARGRLGSGFLGFGGCGAFWSGDARGSAGSWMRWNGSAFSEPGVNGSTAQRCLPGVPGNVCCPIVHFNTYLRAHVVVYTKWGQGSTLFIAAATDEEGLAWGPSVVLLDVGPGSSVAYGQIIGAENSTHAGRNATLVYALAPPTSGQPRDFVARSIVFE